MAITNTSGQSDRAVAAMRLVNDEIERHHANGNDGDAVLCCRVGFRLYFGAREGKLCQDVEWIFEMNRFRRLARAIRRGSPPAPRECVDTLFRLAMRGIRPLGLVESVKVSTRPRRPVTPTPISPTARG